MRAVALRLLSKVQQHLHTQTFAHMNANMSAPGKQFSKILKDVMFWKKNRPVLNLILYVIFIIMKKKKNLSQKADSLSVFFSDKVARICGHVWPSHLWMLRMCTDVQTHTEKIYHSKYLPGREQHTSMAGDMALIRSSSRTRKGWLGVLSFAKEAGRVVRPQPLKCHGLCEIKTPRRLDYVSIHLAIRSQVLLAGL